MKKLILILFLISSALAGYSQCADDSNQWAQSWTSCEKSFNPNPDRPVGHWILYEFSSNHYIDSSHIWNANRVGETDNGIKDIIVDYSLDGNTWIQLGNYNIPKAKGTADYQGTIGPDFGNVYVKKILITVLSTHGTGDCATIGEVIFAINAEECHGIIDDCGNCNGPGAPMWYADDDGDGYGDPDDAIVACEQPPGYVNNATDLCDNGQLGWEEISALFQKSCNGCHIANSAGGLNLNTYESFLQGGLNCGSNLATGTTLVDVITIDLYDGCTSPISAPAMNSRSGSPLSAIELDMIQRWISAGTPEACTDFCPADDFVSVTFPEGIIAYRQTSSEISSTSMLEATSNITFDAGQQVLLDAGFTVLQGAQFLAKLDGCEDDQNQAPR